jgi:hypothetical protein
MMAIDEPHGKNHVCRKAKWPTKPMLKRNGNPKTSSRYRPTQTNYWNSKMLQISLIKEIALGNHR